MKNKKPAVPAQMTSCSVVMYEEHIDDLVVTAFENVELACAFILDKYAEKRCPAVIVDGTVRKFNVTHRPVVAIESFGKVELPDKVNKIEKG